MRSLHDRPVISIQGYGVRERTEPLSLRPPFTGVLVGRETMPLVEGVSQDHPSGWLAAVADAKQRRANA